MTDREIYEEVRGPLMRFAASLVGPVDAADLVSEAVTATLQRRNLASIEEPQAYLMQAVLNRARSHGRRMARERQVVARLGSNPATTDGAYVLRPDVARTVAELPVQQRAAIYLVYWEDMAPSDAARFLGVRPATLRRYLYLARKKLRRHLDE